MCNFDFRSCVRICSFQYWAAGLEPSTSRFRVGAFTRSAIRHAWMYYMMRSIYAWHFTFYTWRFAFISSFFQYLAIVDKWAKCRDDKLWQMVTFQNQDQNSTTPLGKIFLNRMGLSPKTVFSPLVVEISPSENCNEENCFLQRFFCNGGSAKKKKLFRWKKAAQAKLCATPMHDAPFLRILFM